ncbi:beta-1,4-galactosyltransferase, putative [Perkinsus marinus ATCC 50983]|uniref:Beta-1,4-galactosyltransferase, putative n=1 Tax=Perkinsus marinus (strain ATCC 50983 / TXsc) TaxID=423536 RepID=C5LKC9_PERM5|nr:beta-1,4-galactosyltransferase, putative [Perkinsus marinus ATCC 50983]EER02811.1 beta-1,4-galactosyltransferase, putative [Perkinsus marinus ATCC 50983]|eukprot:XP_002770995.1 beta-1,4-galactosyltransferase, putative [Perkinsus marinus ATCC 50983]
MALTLPSVIVCLLFSDIGFGVDVYNVLYDFETLSIALYSILIALCISLFLCDVQRWQLWPKLGACVIGWALFVSATLLNGTSYPQGPLIVGLLHGPVLLGVIRYLLCIRVYSGVFYRAVYILAVVLGLLVLGLWLCWIVVENWDGQHYWNEDERTRLSLELDDLHKALKVDYILHCVRVAGGQGALSVDPEENNRLYEKCSTTLTTAYIVYVTPMIVSFTLLVLAVFCKLRAKNASVENGDALSNSQETEASLKTFVVFTSLLIMCFWIASSIAGSSSSMSGAVMGFAAAGSLVLFVWAFLSFGKARLVEAAHKSPLVASLLDMASSDWARALFICMVNVGLLIVVLLDFLRQCIRSLWWKDRPEKERGKLSGGMTGSFSTLCFRPFELTDRISEEFSEGGLDGSVVNLLKPLGWLSLTREETDDSIVKTTTAVIKKEEKQTPWRSDFKCGSGWPSDDGKREKSECNPDGEFPCCSTSGYRDRESHYKKFERHFADFVRELNVENRRNQEFHIFLIEQFDNQLFNRGWLFNVGFTEALRSLNEKPPDCIVMQDVDNLPMSGIGDYATTNYCGEDVIPFANHNPEASK